MPAVFLLINLGLTSTLKDSSEVNQIKKPETSNPTRREKIKHVILEK